MIYARWIGFNLRSGYAFCAVAACLCFTAASTSLASAQPSANKNFSKNVSVSFNRTPIQTAINSLFTQVGLNYSLDPSVQGSVTADLRDVPFQAALHAILNANQPRLTYQIHDGVYQIRPLSAPVRPRSSAPRQSGRPTVGRTASRPSSAANEVRIPLDYGDAGAIMRFALGGGDVVPPAPLPGQEERGNAGRPGSTGGAPGAGTHTPPSVRPTR